MNGMNGMNGMRSTGSQGNRNYHMKYRRSVYRRRKIKLAIIISSVSLIILLAGFLIIGNLLNSDEPSPVPDSGENKDQNENSGSQNRAASPIQGYPLVLFTEDSTTLSSRINSLPDAASAVSVRLDGGDGTLLYSSDIARSITSLTFAEGAPKASAFCKTVKDRGLYLSATLTLDPLRKDDPLIRSVELSAYSAMAAEVLLAGADEVLFLLPSGLTSGYGSDEILSLTDTLCELGASVRALAPEGRFGFALSDDIMRSDQVAVAVDKLSAAASFLAINASEATDKEGNLLDPYGISDLSQKQAFADHLEGVMERDLFYLLSKNMRLVIPNTTDEELNAQLISLAERYENNKNWQMLP